MDYLNKKTAIEKLEKWSSNNSEDIAYYLNDAIDIIGKKRFGKLTGNLYSLKGKELARYAKNEDRLDNLTKITYKLIDIVGDDTKNGYEQLSSIRFNISILKNI